MAEATIQTILEKENFGIARKYNWQKWMEKNT